MRRFTRPLYVELVVHSPRPLGRLAVAALILFAAAAPSVAGMMTRGIGESKAPLESEEESQGKVEEALVNSQRRFRWKPGHVGSGALSHQAVQVHRIIHSRPAQLVEGHRLSNGLLAPLTC